jgi:hypothetical protein
MFWFKSIVVTENAKAELLRTATVRNVLRPAFFLRVETEMFPVSDSDSKQLRDIADLDPPNKHDRLRLFVDRPCKFVFDIHPKTLLISLITSRSLGIDVFIGKPYSEGASIIDFSDGEFKLLDKQGVKIIPSIPPQSE